MEFEPFENWNRRDNFMKNQKSYTSECPTARRRSCLLPVDADNATFLGKDPS